MIYNLTDILDQTKLMVRINQLIQDGKTIELKEVREKRTIAQNKYIHKLFEIFGNETGYTADEAKTLLKRECPFMRYEKNGKPFLKHTSEMDTKELSEFTEWCIEYAGKNGIFLPTPEEYLKHQNEIEKELNKNKKYL